MLADTHCHLDFETFDGDREQVLERAARAGIETILNPGIDLASSRSAVGLARTFPAVHAAVGVHPNEATQWQPGTPEILRNLAGNPKVVAIGEIGLDYYRDRAPRDLQKKIFQEQLGLAAELGLPAIVHNRQATEDVLEILIEWQTGLVNSGSLLAERPGVLHSYSEELEPALRGIEHNFRIGFTGPVTFRNAPDLQRVAAGLPLDHLLIETDAPFLTPHPYRGKRNEPAYVRLVAEKLAELQGVAFESVASWTTANAARLFDW